MSLSVPGRYYHTLIIRGPSIGRRHVRPQMEIRHIVPASPLKHLTRLVTVERSFLTSYLLQVLLDFKGTATRFWFVIMDNVIAIGSLASLKFHHLSLFCIEDLTFQLINLIIHKGLGTCHGEKLLHRMTLYGALYSHCGVLILHDLVRVHSIVSRL